MPFTIETARSIFPETLTADAVPATVARFNQLTAEDQLALIWFAYVEMGKSITVAAPGAANMQFAERTLEQIRNMSYPEQSQVMCDLVNRADTDICRTYATWTPNIKLGFWYRLGEWMDDGTVAPIPEGYQLSPNAASVLTTISGLDPDQQITVLRNVVVSMGFDPEKIEDYQPVEEPVAPTTAPDKREPIAIAGVTNPTVLSYMECLNANDFETAIDLFAEGGGLQPPFERPIVGKDAIMRFFRDECQNLKLDPKHGVAEPASEEGYTQIKVTGTVQTPWFGANVGMNMAWRFLLDTNGKIFFVAIDLLASPSELKNLARS